ncbi:MAG: efflux transporter, family, subunit [Schlesneria sp.]|nr:efflux transporter, family, subunit [Schlesneria sp.]
MASAAQVLPPSGDVSRLTKVWRGTWMFAAMVVTVIVVAVLLKPHQPANPGASKEPRPAPPIEPIRIVSQGVIAIAPDTPLQKELATTKVVTERSSAPLVSVSGTILAQVREGTGSFEDRWQFSTSELSSLYADWLRTLTEIEFAQSQLTKTKELAVADTTFLEANVKRLNSVPSGTVPEKEILQAKATLLQAQLQREKDVFSAESTLRTAVKQKSAIERNLSRAGIETIVFGQAAEHMVLVAANVPETQVSQIHMGQACEVRFYGYPEVVFPAHVEAISSTLTPERRTLRVLFDVTDDKGMLKPGMFAEVGLGTDERDSIQIPSTSLLHIGRSDYVLADIGNDQWRVTEVRVGEVRKDRCEIQAGLKDGDRIISRGAILLKTLAGQSLTMPSRSANNAETP